MGDKRMKNIYQKLHQACLNAGGVKKGEKVKGMHFNPLLHDAVQEWLCKHYQMKDYIQCVVIKQIHMTALLWLLAT